MVLSTLLRSICTRQRIGVAPGAVGVLEARLDSSRLHGALALCSPNAFLCAICSSHGKYNDATALCMPSLSPQPVQALVRSSPKLAAQPEFQALSNLRGVDVVAVRLFFKERLDMPRAASVAGGGMAPGKKHEA